MKEQPLKKSFYEAIVIGGSAGSMPVISEILATLPVNFPLPVIVCIHRMRNHIKGFVETFSTNCNLKVVEPDDKEPICNSKVYIAPANYHLCIEKNRQFALNSDEPVNFCRPAIDVTMETAAGIYKDKLIGIILSGANSDGAMGLQWIKEHNGITIVQSPEEAVMKTMPEQSLKLVSDARVLNTKQIIELLNQLY